MGLECLGVAAVGEVALLLVCLARRSLISVCDMGRVMISTSAPPSGPSSSSSLSRLAVGREGASGDITGCGPVPSSPRTCGLGPWNIF
jgi:hypothetical protein